MLKKQIYHYKEELNRSGLLLCGRMFWGGNVKVTNIQKDINCKTCLNRLKK